MEACDYSVCWNPLEPGSHFDFATVGICYLGELGGKTDVLEPLPALKHSRQTHFSLAAAEHPTPINMFAQWPRSAPFLVAISFDTLFLK